MHGYQPMNYLLKPVVAYFATKRSEAVEQALLAVVDNPRIDDLSIRLDAVRALLDMDGPSAEQLGDRTRALVSEAL